MSTVGAVVCFILSALAFARTVVIVGLDYAGANDGTAAWPWALGGAVLLVAGILILERL